MSRDRITLGLALAIMVLTVAVGEWHWLGVLISAVAMFLIVWGRAPQATEAIIGRIPRFGPLLLDKILHPLDLVLTPRDLEAEAHFRQILTGYGPLMRKNLRRLLVTDDPRVVLQQEWSQLFTDRIAEHPYSGPAGIRPELKELMKHLLSEFNDG